MVPWIFKTTINNFVELAAQIVYITGFVGGGNLSGSNNCIELIDSF